MRTVTVVVAALGAACLAGCGDGETMKPSACADPVLGPPGGSVSARVEGSTVVMNVALEGLPRGVRRLYMGLKTACGKAASLRSASSSAGGLQAAPAAGFTLSGAGEGSRAICLQVTYDLPAGVDLAGGMVFTVTLGKPDLAAARSMGIATCVSARDGTPLPVDPELLGASPATGGGATELGAPAASFRLATNSAAGGSTPLTPVLASVGGGGGSLPVALVQPR